MVSVADSNLVSTFQFLEDSRVSTSEIRIFLLGALCHMNQITYLGISPKLFLFPDCSQNCPKPIGKQDMLKGKCLGHELQGDFPYL